MSTDPAIRIEGLWKTYRVQAPGQQRWRFLAPKTDFHALSDVSLDVPEGTVLGIVGGNGAGKSTLLKILSRITDPSRGRVVLRGRSASILEIGTGFHPELSGLDNVYLNGAVHGLSRRDIRARLSAILEFADIGDWIHEPAKRYSSGMYLRLAFSVAAHLDPDILIADELLAVGDQQFRERCFGRFRAVAGEGRTVVLVSHEAPAITALCTHVAWLQKGKILMTGAPEDVIEAYHTSAHVAGGIVALDKGVLVLENVRATYAPGLVGEASVSIEVRVRATEPVRRLVADAAFGHAVVPGAVQIMTSLRAQPEISLEPGESARWSVHFRVPDLRPGHYRGGLSLQEVGGTPLLQVTNLPLCTVHPRRDIPELCSPEFHAVMVPAYDAIWAQDGPV